MNEIQGSSLTDRLKAAADARKALLAAFRPKPTATDPNFKTRAEVRAAELKQVREARSQAKAAKLQAAADNVEAVRQEKETAEAAALDATRGARKERKALTKVEAKTKRDARYAARKARR